MHASSTFITVTQYLLVVTIDCMSDDPDLLVIGSGAAGATVASKCRTAGWSVAIAEERTPGGTCPNRGCDPKKVLVEASAALSQAGRLTNRGIATAGAHIDWPALQRWKSTFTDAIPGGTREKWADLGVELIEEQARFLDERRVQVGQRVLSPGHVLIATGARPRLLEVPGEQEMFGADVLVLERLRPEPAVQDLLPVAAPDLGDGLVDPVEGGEGHPEVEGLPRPSQLVHQGFRFVGVAGGRGRAQPGYGQASCQILAGR